MTDAAQERPCVGGCAAASFHTNRMAINAPRHPHAARGNQAASCRRRWAVCMMVWAGAGGRMATGLTIVAIALASFAATPAMREVGAER